MAGRFRKEIRNSSGTTSDIPGYERRGYGGKIELGNESHRIGIVLFKSLDRYKQDIHNDSGSISPSSNLVLGLNTAHSYKGKLTFSAEYNASAITEDMRLHDSVKAFPVKLPGYLLNTNITSRFAQAYSLKLEGKIGNTGIGLSFLHIDPEYKSFGCAFINNDLENYLFNFSTSLRWAR